MCEQKNYGANAGLRSDPALSLAAAINRHCGASISDSQVRAFILARWPDIKRWAHAIHEEGEKGEAELREAAQILSGLNADGFLKASKGEHMTVINEAFMKLAKKALEK